MAWFGKMGRGMAAAAILITFLAGCATKAEGPPAPKPAVHHITIIPVDSPGTTYSQNRNLAAGFLFPAWIQWLDNKWKTEQFAEQMKQTMLGLGPTMTAALVEQLTHQGYQVDVLEQVPRYAEHPDEVDYSKVQTEGAVLHVWFEDVAMYSGQASRYYVPRVNVSAYLTFPAAEESLYYETIYYGADSRDQSTYWGMPAHQDYKYETFDLMVSRPEHVSEGFSVGVRTVAEHLAQEFRRRFDGPAPQ